MQKKQEVLRSLKIRQAKFSDLLKVTEIEKSNFTKPWGITGFISELFKRKTLFLVAELNEDIKGYIVTWINLDEAYIANIAVDPEYQGYGIGGALLNETVDRLKKLGTSKCYLEVRVSNEKARRLYEKFGFKVVGVRKKMYHDGEDALVMETRIDDQNKETEVHHDGTGNYRETLADT